jgi:hypothetical protein
MTLVTLNKNIYIKNIKYIKLKKKLKKFIIFWLKKRKVVAADWATTSFPFFF